MRSPNRHIPSYASPLAEMHPPHPYMYSLTKYSHFPLHKDKKWVGDLYMKITTSISLCKNSLRKKEEVGGFLESVPFILVGGIEEAWPVSLVQYTASTLYN